MTKREILNLFSDLCEENNTTINDIIKLYIGKQINFFGDDDTVIDDITNMLTEDYYTLWDNQPTIEDDEELAFAIQHTRDVFDIIV